jgi:hypothetical protein
MAGKKTQGLDEAQTQEKWLRQHTGWCKPYEARIQVSACKQRKKSFPAGHCKSCRGLVPV